MFFSKKVILGAEHDERLFKALSIVLKSLGGEVREKSYWIVGSQEITKYEAKLNTGRLKIVAETYEGLAIKGKKSLVLKVKELVDAELSGRPPLGPE